MFPSRTQVEAIAQNQLHKETVRLMGEAESYAKIAFPLGPEIEIQDREQQVLLLAERIKGGDRADPTIVLQASTHLWSKGVAELRIGGKLKAAVGPFPLQAPVEHGIERRVPGTPLLIDDWPDFYRPGIGRERALLIADLRGQTQTNR